MAIERLPGKVNAADDQLAALNILQQAAGTTERGGAVAGGVASSDG
jgi:hypothetical protein